MEKIILSRVRPVVSAFMLVFLNSFFPMGAFAEENSSWAYTPVPIFGYDPAVGFILGGAVFTYPTEGPGWVTSNKIIYSTEGMLKLKTDILKISTSRSFGYGINVDVGQGMMRYFGEGGQTQVDKMVNVFSNDLELKPFIEFWIDETKVWRLQAETLSGYVTRVTDVNNNLLDNRRGGGLGETSSGVGILYKQDNRDDFLSPTEGKYFQIEGNFAPNWMSNLPSGESVFQILTNYDQLISWGLSNVFAYRLKAGTTIGGTPSFLRRYTLGGGSLGGATSLRGYYFDRFRGNHFYGIQLENRKTIIDRLSGAFFVDVGDMANQTLQDFSSLKVGYGIGLRFGLPPKGRIKIRLDYGLSQDQSAFIIGFNEII